jgi:hypothetical protein
MLLSHLATARGSKRTHVPTRKHGSLPDFAHLKILTGEIASSSANSAAFRAWGHSSILSASDFASDTDELQA